MEGNLGRLRNQNSLLQLSEALIQARKFPMEGKRVFRALENVASQDAVRSPDN
jgi:hypothetical protein